MPVSVEVRDNSMEALEFALRKFKKKMEVSKLLDEYKARQYFIKPSLAKREKRKSRLKYGQSRNSF
jgi:ribosomal protein S21